MKIAFLSVFYPYRGGIAQYNALLYRAFEKKNDINAYTFTRQYPQILFPGSTQYASENENVDQIPALRVLDSINPLTYINTAKKIARTEPDLLMMSHWMPFLAPSLGTVAKRLRKKGTKVISVLHNVTPHEHRISDKLLNRYYLNQNDGFVVMSQAVKNDLLSYIPDAKCIVHPFPVFSQFGEKIDKITARKKLNIPVDKKVLLFFGLIRDYKGLDLVIDAFGKLNHEYFLIIAGESYKRFESYQQQINANKIKENIMLHIRYIPDDEVPLYFSAADVNVLPYRTATQSAVVALAYQFDSPVIVTDVGGLREMVEPYQTGLVVSKLEPELLAGAIRKFFNENMENKCKENIKKFKADCSWDAMYEKIVDLYLKIKND